MINKTCEASCDEMYCDVCHASSDGLSELEYLRVKQAYVRYVCDYRMQQLGLKPQFDVETQPIPWIDYITGNTLGRGYRT